MRYLKSLIIAAFAFAMAAGTLLAADDPLEIHGGGRVGITVNNKLGSDDGAADNALGTMPNYGESHYMSLSFSKKTTADGGAWSKATYAFDSCPGRLVRDCDAANFRTRAMNLEFGGLDFLPAGTTLRGGLMGSGIGWVGMQDYSFVSLAGVGIGLSNIGGVASISYYQYDNTDGEVDKLGKRGTHHVVMNINMPMIEIIASLGYSKKASGQANDKNLTEFLGGALYHAPVYGINIGGVISTNGYARQCYFAAYDTWFKAHAGGVNSSGTNVDKTEKATAVRIAAWTVTDLAPGLYIAPAFRYDMLMTGKDFVYPSGAALGTKNTLNRIDFACKISKQLTKNIAFCPNLGVERAWDKEKSQYGEKALLIIQATAAVEIGLDTGYWAGQKIQLYGTYTKRDNKHKYTSGSAVGKASKMDFGTLITFGF